MSEHLEHEATDTANGELDSTRDVSDQLISLKGSRRPMHLRHLIFGWALVLSSTIVGVTLEALHGFKMGWYLDVGNEIRRLMLTLGHGHGTLLGIVNLVFAAHLSSVKDWPSRSRDFASRCLMVASLLIPGGFLLGGIHIYDGDPGLGIMLVPIGALAFITMLIVTLRAAIRQPWSPEA